MDDALEVLVELVDVADLLVVVALRWDDDLEEVERTLF